MLARGEVDAALLVGVNPAELNHAAQRQLEKIPRVLIDWRSEAAVSRADVAICIARPGIETGGTAYRADGVPLPLRPVRRSVAPAAVSVLETMERSILATREAIVASREP
jgi:formylmethanofuran dehydrogenase subunit B